MKATLRCACGETSRMPSFAYDARPPGEVDFPLAETYRRRYDECRICGHFFGVHDMDLSGLYEGAYVDATYQSAEGLAKNFRRIISLPPEKSDNAGRAARIDAFGRSRRSNGAERRLLDVGSGLGVFPYAMKGKGWEVTALDPDARATRHIEAVVGVAAVTGDFLKVDVSSLGSFDAVTFNKVLEHIDDPITLLERALPLLACRGFVYVEVPDVAAAAEGAGREEFFIDHFHVFSPASLAQLIEAAGLRVLEVARIREPSTKFTVFAFAEAHPARVAQ
jgi:SAM-dependent methyltransferase